MNYLLGIDLGTSSLKTIVLSQGAELAAGDYPNAAIQLGMAHYVDGELVSETLDIPIHLVVE